MPAISEDFREEIYDEFLKIIIKVLEGAVLEVEPVRAIAREFLALEPFTSMDDMKVKIKAFTEKNKDFAELYVKFLQHQEDNNLDPLLSKMRDYLKSNKVDEALNLVKPS